MKNTKLVLPVDVANMKRHCCFRESLSLERIKNYMTFYIFLVVMRHFEILQILSPCSLVLTCEYRFVETYFLYIRRAMTRKSTVCILSTVSWDYQLHVRNNFFPKPQRISNSNSPILTHHNNVKTYTVNELIHQLMHFY
jgi:hypothetical protein